MKDGNAIDLVIVGCTLALAVLIGLIYMWLHDRMKSNHNDTHRKLDVVRQDIGDVSDQVQGVSDQVEGVRINIDGHADALSHQAAKDRAQAKKFRLSIFRDFKEWLAHRGNGAPPNDGSSP